MIFLLHDSIGCMVQDEVQYSGHWSSTCISETALKQRLMVRVWLALVISSPDGTIKYKLVIGSPTLTYRPPAFPHRAMSQR